MSLPWLMGDRSKGRILIPGAGVAVASAPLGATCPLRAAAGHQPYLWPSDHSDRRRTEPGSLLSPVPGDGAERTAIDPSVAAAQLDRVCVSDTETFVGH